MKKNFIILIVVAVALTGFLYSRPKVVVKDEAKANRDKVSETKSAEKHTDWNAKQAYIALGQLMHTCASLRIDATPMEGFESTAFDEILDLEKDNLKSVLVCAMGYRSEVDNNQYLAKVRKSSGDIFEVR
jgi:nitroreductase